MARPRQVTGRCMNMILATDGSTTSSSRSCWSNRYADVDRGTESHVDCNRFGDSDSDAIRHGHAATSATDSYVR